MFKGKSRWIGLAVLMAMTMLCSCDTAKPWMGADEPKGQMDVDVKPFGKTPDGRQVRLYSLRNAAGMTAEIMTYGAIVISLEAPDKDGNMADIVLGYDNLQDYLKETPYFGAIVGRYGNRIGKGKFTLDGVTYTLATNNDENHLHGGTKGFDKVVWDDEPVWRPDGVGVKLSYLSKDGEEDRPMSSGSSLEMSRTASPFSARRLMSR